MEQDELLRVLAAFDRHGLEASGWRRADVPVERFRSIEAMNAATPREDGEADARDSSATAPGSGACAL